MSTLPEPEKARTPIADELDEYLAEALKNTAFSAAWNRLVVPEPIRGGTFFYCPGRREPDLCGWPRRGWATGRRFRTLKAYRRHWRKVHGTGS